MIAEVRLGSQYSLSFLIKPNAQHAELYSRRGTLNYLLYVNVLRSAHVDNSQCCVTDVMIRNESEREMRWTQTRAAQLDARRQHIPITSTQDVKDK